MYKLVSTISIFIRMFIFPNPFTKLFELYFANSVLSLSAALLADGFNLVVGGSILCVICYPLVGIVYDRGEAPAVGSILYGVFVLINSKLLVWISQGFSEVNLKLLLIRFVIGLIIEIIILVGIRYVKETYFY